MKRGDWPHRACLAFGVALGLAVVVLGALLLPLVFKDEFGVPHGMIAAVLMVIGGILVSDCWSALRGVGALPAPADDSGRWHALAGELVELDRKFSRLPDAKALESIVAATNRSDHQDAIRRIEELKARHPDSLWLRLALAGSLQSSGRPLQAVEFFRSLLEEPALSAQAHLVLATTVIDACAKEHQVAEIRTLGARLLARDMPADVRVELLDFLACSAFYHDCHELLDDAWAWLADALKLAPGLLTLQGTRASLLIERNRDFAAAKPLLEELLRTSSSACDQGICKFYFALCSKDVGDLDKARILAEDAVKLHPEPWLLRRKQREFPTAAQP